MQDQFEESEMIDVIEVRYELVKVKQQKYVCRCGGCVETAIGPTRALPGSRYSLAFAIKVLIDKWMDHIPLERQVRILERHGLVVTSQTLWDLAYAVAQRLSLVDAALLEHVKAQPVIGLDQTGWASPRGRVVEAVADVVPHGARRRRASDSRRQECCDVQRSRR